ncbi:MAG: tetratricopeptide repeat protein [Thermoguttaceae bacterium]
MGKTFQFAGLLVLGGLFAGLVDPLAVPAAPSGHGGGGGGGGHSGFSSGSYGHSPYSGTHGHSSYLSGNSGSPAGNHWNHPGGSHDPLGYHHGNWWWNHWYYPYYAPFLAFPFWYDDWDSFYPGLGDYGYNWAGYGSPNLYGYGPADAVPPGANLPPAPTITGYPPAAGGAVGSAPPSPDSDNAAGSELGGPESELAAGREYYLQAMAAFERKDYREAARLANHATIEMPRDAKVHRLLSLALFALKEYRGGAMEAHAAAALGPMIDWQALYAYYHDLPTYSGQLGDLAAFVRKNPSALDALFLLAYHDMMMGHVSEAKPLLETIVAKAPQDRIAAQLLKQTEKSAGKTPPPPPPAPAKP